MYRHTQSGTVTRVATIAGLVVAALILTQVSSQPILWLVVVAALGVFAFSSMTVAVDHQRLAFWFGPGWIRRSFPLADIRSWTIVKNPWWYGWGIHRTPDGWLYNVAGTDAIQLDLHDGRHLRVGTDEPERLAEAIRMMKDAA